MSISKKFLLLALLASLVPVLILGHFSYANVEIAGTLVKTAENGKCLKAAARELVRESGQSFAGQVADVAVTAKNLSDVLMYRKSDSGLTMETMLGGVVNGKVVFLNSKLEKIKSRDIDLNRILSRAISGAACGYYNHGLAYACFYPINAEFSISKVGKMRLFAVTSINVNEFSKYLGCNSTANSAMLEGVKGSEFKAFTLSIAIGLLLTCVVAYFARDVSRSLVEISRAADRVSSGQLEVRIPHQDREDEVGRVAESVERVKRSLVRAVESLEEALK